MILAFLEADLQEAQASIVHDRSIFRNEGEGRPYITTEESNDFRRRYAVILDARRPIRSLALVSRSWYQASTPFLYARPFLFGIDQLQSLRKTVCDRHKEIADFVKHPVMIFRRMNKTEYDFRPLPMVAERPIMTFKSVLSIQCACKNLSSLTIEIPSQRKDGRPLQNGAELFLEGAEGASIKNVRIIGCLCIVNPGVPARFDRLGTLCLNSVQLAFPGPWRTSIPILRTSYFLGFAYDSYRE